MKNPKVCVVIVNWKNWQDTIPCLDSLNETKYENLEVVVVDNASENDSIKELSKRKEIKLLVASENNGFGAGQNIGLRYGLEHGADYLFILNNDTIVAPGIFEKLLKGFEEPKVGAVAPRIFYFTAPTSHPESVRQSRTSRRISKRFEIFLPRQARDQNDSSLRNPNLKSKNKIWWTGGFLDLKNGRIINIQTHNLSLFPNGGNCDYLVGCAVLIKAEVLRKVGLFNEEFFHTAEDVDLSLRIRQAGYQLRVTPEAYLWHKVSASGGGDLSPFYLYYLERNRLWLMKKYNYWQGLVSWLRISPLLFKRLIASYVKGKSLLSSKAVLQGWFDFSRGKIGENCEGK